MASSAKASIGTQLRWGDGTAGSAKTIATAPTGAVRSAGIVTILTTVAHGFTTSSEVTIAGVTDSSFNGVYIVRTVPDSTHFTYYQMSLSDATSGTGTATLAQTYALIAEVNSIAGPSQKVGTIDVTNMDSTGGYAEFIMGVIEAGELALEGNFTNATGQAQLRTDFAAKTSRGYNIVLPGTVGSWTATALVSSLNHNHKSDAQLTFSATLRITGAPTLKI